MLWSKIGPWNSISYQNRHSLSAFFFGETSLIEVIFFHTRTRNPLRQFVSTDDIWWRQEWKWMLFSTFNMIHELRFSTPTLTHSILENKRECCSSRRICDLKRNRGFSLNNITFWLQCLEDILLRMKDGKGHKLGIELNFPTESPIILKTVLVWFHREGIYVL